VVSPGAERAFVFQDFALLPWANTLRNVAFGLELRGVPKAQRFKTAKKLGLTVKLHAEQLSDLQIN